MSDSDAKKHEVPKEAPAEDAAIVESFPGGGETWDLTRLVLESDCDLKCKKALLRELRKMSPRHNRSLYMVVVVILGLVAFTTVVWGFSLLTYSGCKVDQIPASLIALGSTALGALAGLLTPSPRDQ